MMDELRISEATEKRYHLGVSRIDQLLQYTTKEVLLKSGITITDIYSKKSNFQKIMNPLIDNCSNNINNI
jgi:hypothetical protein